MTERAKLVARFIPVIFFVVVLWVIELVNLTLGHALNIHGLIPRSSQGLDGIFWSPFLHGNLSHLLTNTAPLLILGGLVCVSGTRSFFFATGCIIVLGGLGVWVIGRTAIHVGASGVVFGYFGFLVARAWFTRTVGAFIAAAITIVLYAGLIWGILPQGRFISWEAHLCGLLAGVLAARMTGRGNHGSGNSRA